MRRVGALIPSFGQADREGQARIAGFLDPLRKLGWADVRIGLLRGWLAIFWPRPRGIPPKADHP